MRFPSPHPPTTSLFGYYLLPELLFWPLQSFLFLLCAYQAVLPLIQAGFSPHCWRPLADPVTESLAHIQCVPQSIMWWDLSFMHQPVPGL